MLNFQTLDNIADTYIPALGVIIAINIAAQLRNPKSAFKELCKVLLLTSIAYGLMFADASQHLWSRQHLDFSTHAALAAVCSWYLFWLYKARQGVLSWRWAVYLWPVSFGLYTILMRYQGYHSWADMLTTLIAITPFLFIHYFATR